MTDDEYTHESFRQEAAAWLSSVAELRPETSVAWGHGDDSVVVFDDLSEDDERALIEAGRKWEQAKYDAGWGAVTWPPDVGGRGLAPSFGEVFFDEEARFAVPRRNELFEVTKLMVAPTIDVWGTEAQKVAFIRPFLRTDWLCCQLFSEPGAGSDLAGVATRATRSSDGWCLEGQKVWTSGARQADWGLAICRTDPAAAKHAGMTAFLVPMDSPGVTVRPIRQMTGGSSFSEVFLDGVILDDGLRVGPEGAGWKVALTTLATERSASGSLGGGTMEQVRALATQFGHDADPIHRQSLADLWIHRQVDRFNVERASQRLEAGGLPGPEGSINRLSATANLTRMAEAVASMLGPSIIADVGAWGTYAWTEQLLGAPGYHIAGGSDEIQHNIIGERVLGLPREPR